MINEGGVPSVCATLVCGVVDVDFERPKGDGLSSDCKAVYTSTSSWSSVSVLLGQRRLKPRRGIPKYREATNRNKSRSKRTRSDYIKQGRIVKGAVGIAGLFYRGKAMSALSLCVQSQLSVLSLSSMSSTVGGRFSWPRMGRMGL